jgi:hypothetical protein
VATFHRCTSACDVPGPGLRAHNTAVMELLSSWGAVNFNQQCAGFKTITSAELAEEPNKTQYPVSRNAVAHRSHAQATSASPIERADTFVER